MNTLFHINQICVLPDRNTTAALILAHFCKCIRSEKKKEEGKKRCIPKDKMCNVYMYFLITTKPHVVAFCF